jgi:pSer/pThr/pTyr-binding forkhead associated (FHA) protein
MASLFVVKGDRPGARIPLPASGTFVLGRNPDCQVVIPNQAVSRRHAQIVCEDGRYYIEDLRARSPAAVNNLEVATRTPLAHGDRIRICDAVFRFELEPMASESETDDGGLTVEDRPGRRSQPVLEALAADRLRALVEAAGRLHVALDAAALPGVTADELLRLFPQADRAFVVLREEPAGRLVPRAAKTRNAPEPTPEGFSRPVARRCLESREPLLSEDVVGDPGVQALGRTPLRPRVRSVMGAPLIGSDGTAVGVLLVDTEDRARRFTLEDQHLLTATAEQASIAFTNARKYAEAVRRAAPARPSAGDRVAMAADSPAPVPPDSQPMQRWRKTADRLREVRRQQDARWGHAGATAVGKFLTGEATAEQRRQVEEDLKSHPELVEVLEDVRDAAGRRRGVP